MKKILKKIAAITIFLCLLGLSFYKVDDLLEEKKARQQYKAFYESDTNFDVIFMGTSHTYHSVFTQELWKEYGISSFNWGYSHCTLAEDYYLLQDIVKFTDPKLVVIDLYGLMEYENQGNKKYKAGKIEQQHVQFDSLPLSKSKIQAAYDVFDDYENNYDFIFNFALYHNRWTELSEEDFNVTYSVAKGSGILYGHNNANYIKNKTYTEIDINSVCSDYIPKIADFCNKKNIELLFTYLPFPAESMQQNIAYTLNNYLSQYDCSYVNMLDENILDTATDIYKDKSHLNYMGAYKTTLWLGKYIQDKYALNDYSDSEEYSSWHEEYEKYVDYKAGRFKFRSKRANLIHNLILSYGSDFDVEVKIDTQCKKIDSDKLLNRLLFNPDSNISVENVDGLSYKDKNYDIVLIIKKSANGEEVLHTGYTY
ncbi:MAG: hypothetical protein HDT39_00755 [Lachnospiraceae bacterium]|nr:hypothetical protein [Lachnospiraceae bacterium]